MIKKFLPAVFFLLAFVFIITSLSVDRSDYVLAEEAMVLSDRPVLPDDPIDYDVRFSEHIRFGSWTVVDTGDFNAKITPDGATLGRVLFYDKKLSFNNRVACGSCHIQEFAFADNKQFSEGFEDRLSARNSPNLNDLGWAGTPFTPFFSGNGEQMLFWDARESNMDEMMLAPIQHEDELAKDLEYMEQKLALIDYYPELFEKAYGDTEITAERVGNALAQFVSSMSVFDSKFDMVMRNESSFTAEEEKGHRLFELNCESACHSSPNFSSAMPMNNGLDEIYDDEGVAAWSGNAGDIGKFKSPSLRNIEFTAPYMHDGRFNTLEEVLDFYSEEVKEHPNNDFGWVGQGGTTSFGGFDFSDDEKKAIIAFLKTLTSTELLTDKKWSDPFNTTSSVEDESLNNAIKIYPNPMTESFTLDLGNAGNKPVALKMLDMKGNLVWKDQVKYTAKQVFEFEKLPKGIYLLKIETEGNVMSKKLLIR